MDGLKVRVKVKVNLSARQWQLYSQPGCAAAAKTLNLAVEKAINASPTFDALKSKRKELHEVFCSVGFGATDTEPLCVLSDVIDGAYGMHTYNRFL
jgi:hypothetical protein